MKQIIIEWIFVLRCGWNVKIKFLLSFVSKWSVLQVHELKIIECFVSFFWPLVYFQTTAYAAYLWISMWDTYSNFHF
jgi:hypothetical protein